MAPQFVVHLENKPGELAHLARALAARGIDIRHIGGVGAGDLGRALVTTSDDDATCTILHRLGHQYVEGAPILVEVLDQPGGIADAAERLARTGVNVQGHPHGRPQAGARRDDLLRRRRDEKPMPPCTELRARMSASPTERVPDAAGRRPPPLGADSTTQAIREPAAALALMLATCPSRPGAPRRGRPVRNPPRERQPGWSDYERE